MSITRQIFQGGGQYFTLTGDHVVKIGQGKLQVFDTNGANRNVDMPDATDPRIRPGGPVFYIANVGAETITVRDNSGTNTIGTVAADSLGMMLLTDESTADGQWYMKVDLIGVIPDVGLSAALYSVGGISPADDLFEYDHVEDTWTQKTDLIEDHQYATAFTIGTIGVYFGHDAVPRDKCTQYDPDTHTALSDLPFGDCRRGQSSGADGKGYLVGHSDDEDETQEFTLGTDTWVAETDMPVENFTGDAETTTDTDLVYNFNGNDGTGGGGGTLTGDVQEYTPSTTTWAAKTDSPFPHTSDMMLYSIEGKIHKLGGDKGFNDEVDDHDQYNPATDTWAAKTDALEKSQGAAYGSPEGIGIHTAGFTTSFNDTTFTYDQSSDMFTQVTDLPDFKSNPTGMTVKP